VYELKKFQEDLRLEMKKPDKDGLKKTHEECLEALTNATKKIGIKKHFLAKCWVVQVQVQVQVGIFAYSCSGEATPRRAS